MKKQFIVIMDDSQTRLKNEIEKRLQEGWRLESFCTVSHMDVMYFIQTLTKD